MKKKNKNIFNKVDKLNKITRMYNKLLLINKLLEVINQKTINKFKKIYFNNRLIKNINNKKLKIYPKIILSLKNQMIVILWNFIVLILINPIQNEKRFHNKRKLEDNLIINLKVKNGNKIKLINSDYVPKIVYINGIKSEIDKNGYVNIEKEGINNVTMQWDKKYKDYSKIFQNIDSIVEIDFSKFDFYGVTSMRSMFYKCINLKNINFNNVNTSEVTEMTSMFEGCTSLISLDLSNFDTLKTKSMENMFKDCKSITSLNLSNFITPTLSKIKQMFFGCESLKKINLPIINTSLVTDIDSLFCGCSSLTSLDLSNFFSKNIKNMNELFRGCLSLKSLDLSNMDTSVVTNMNSLFFECSSIISLNLSSFITSNVRNMDYMFYNCNSLVSIDLSRFITSKIINLERMFYGCKSLISLNLSSFNFSKKNLNYFFYGCNSLKSIQFPKENQLILDVNHMFNGCNSLKSLDLYSFNFSLVENMDNLFDECSSLISLDLSNVNATSVISMKYMFSGCNSLKSVNLTNFITSSIVSMEQMFKDCTSLISLDLRSFDTSLVTDMIKVFINCIQLTSINLSNFNTSSVTSMESMFYGCKSIISLNLSSFKTYLVTDMGSMFNRCQKLTSLDLSNFDFKNVKNIDSIFFDCVNLKYINIYNYTNKSISNINNAFYGTADNLIICINNIYMEQIQSELTLRQCIINNCPKDIKNNNKKIIYDNRICLDECNSDEIYKYEFENFCYDKCPKGTHNIENNYLCEVNLYECVKEYPFLIIKDNVCTENCNCKDFFENACIINNDNNQNHKIIIKNIIDGIQDGLIDELLKEIINNDKKDIIQKENNTLYQITTSFNQNNKDYKDISSIKLGKCEDVLKEKNGLSLNETLIIFKVERKIEGLLIPLISYEIFNPNTKENLNLEHCKDLNIEIMIPLVINENILFKYNMNSLYYNDVCYTYTSESGIDITLYDRRNEYNNNLSLCQNNCKYKYYDSENKKIICQCSSKIEIDIFSDFNKSELFENFINKKSATNYGILKCCKLLFSKNGLIKNVGSYILLSIILLHILSALFVYLKEYDLLCQQINEILNSKNFDNNNEINSKKDLKDELKNATKDSFLSSKKSKIFNKKYKFYNTNLGSRIESDISINSNTMNNKNRKIFKKNKDKKTFNYFDYEINNFSYKEALKIDKRNYFQYYVSLIKSKHILIFTFYNNKDYNSLAIKICLFFFSFALYLVVNTSFFNDSIMNKIYKQKGILKVSNFISQIIYSIIICSIICNILKRLSLSQSQILEIKNEENKYIIKGKVLLLIKCLIIKFICFFVFAFIFLILFWYYISCFCIIYKNTQFLLIKYTLISYFLSLIYPFIFYLFPGIFRISSLNRPGKCLYKLSQVIQFI